MNKDELLQQLTAEIQQKFGDKSYIMFTILILMIFMDTSKWTIPDYLKNVPELHEYVDYLENSELLKEIFGTTQIFDYNN